MSASFEAKFEDRASRYDTRKLDPKRRINICTSRVALLTYPGQVQFLVAANLLARTHANVNLQPVDGSVPIDPRLPFAGKDIFDHALQDMRAVRERHQFTSSGPQAGDLLFNVDPKSSGYVIHGDGWNSWIGLGPSPLRAENETNPFGPALAVILAVAQVYLGDGNQPYVPIEANAFDWTLGFTSEKVLPTLPVGTKIWFNGLGSVGTATLYFLSLFTRRAFTTLVDADMVKVENISRSPLFTAQHASAHTPKVDVAAQFMADAGFPAPAVHKAMLDELKEWMNRDTGTPDLVVSAANERNVQYWTEVGHPPLQIYATTGKTFQVTLLRHIPVKEACSLCLFPLGEQVNPQTCAMDEEAASLGVVLGEEPVDPALPFLSFLAGMMSASEIGKVSLQGYPFTRNRVYVALNPTFRCVHSNIRKLEDCLCQRDTNKHSLAIEGSKFAGLSWIY